MDFISVDATDILDYGRSGILVKDHASPITLLRDKMLKERPSTIDHIRDFLVSWYRLGVITDEEHARLKEARCKDCMPKEWDGVSRFACYAEATIRPSSAG